jgi:ADP-ribose pyrophosphatase
LLSQLTSQNLQVLENPWQTIDNEIVYSNDWIDLQHNSVLNPAGNEGIYGVVHFKNIAVGIVTLDTDLNTYLVGQFRYPLNEYSWELPMGGSPFNENMLDGAKRELEEETGLIAEKWTQVAKMHTSNCVTDEVGYVFLAENLTQNTPFPEETELLSIKKIPFAEAYQMVLNGQITDAISMIGIMKVARILNI